ncbi:MAG: HAMP domain-containing sensor histidine kinase [Bacteroidales bacterium]|jgi:signal transduction histidine kinase
MKNKFYIGLIVIGTILFIALTCIQVLYVKNMFKVQNIIFNRTVNDAMKDALQYFHLNYLSNNEEVSDEDTSLLNFVKSEKNKTISSKFIYKSIDYKLRSTYIQTYILRYLSRYHSFINEPIFNSKSAYCYQEQFHVLHGMNHLTSMNIYKVSTAFFETPYALHVLDSIFRTVFQSYQLYIEYEFALFVPSVSSFMLCSNPSQLHKLSMYADMYTFSLPMDNKVLPAYVMIYFPDKKVYLMKDNAPLILIDIVMIIIIYVLYLLTLLMAIRHIKLIKFKHNLSDNLTHEFKTPISTISLITEALNDKEIRLNDEVYTNYMNIIQTENKRLEQMVDTILYHKKALCTLKPEIVNINTIVEDAIQIVQTLLKKKEGEIIFQKTNHSVIAIDKNKIVIVIKNILENAIKYSQGKPIIKIDIQNNNKDLILSFKDNGIGIEKKELKNIFEQFYRVQTGNIHNVKGYGLGLNYIKTIVKMHGGKINVESKLHKGTIFKIYLPINQRVWKLNKKF